MHVYILDDIPAKSRNLHGYIWQSADQSNRLITLNICTENGSQPPTNFGLTDADKAGLKKLKAKARRWATKHQAEIGVAEMAFGATVIAYGVQTGQIHFGHEVVATKLSEAGMGGAAAGSAIGAIGAALLGSIGVAGATTFAIPVMVLAAGGMAILGAAGYGVGDVAAKLLTASPRSGSPIAGISALSVGTALIIDGARRVVKDERVLRAAFDLKRGVLTLVPRTTLVVARTTKELKKILDQLATPAGGLTAATGAGSWGGHRRQCSRCVGDGVGIEGARGGGGVPWSNLGALVARLRWRRRWPCLGHRGLEGLHPSARGLTAQAVIERRPAAASGAAAAAPAAYLYSRRIRCSGSLSPHWRGC